MTSFNNTDNDIYSFIITVKSSKKVVLLSLWDTCKSNKSHMKLTSFNFMTLYKVINKKLDGL